MCFSLVLFCTHVSVRDNLQKGEKISFEYEVFAKNTVKLSSSSLSGGKILIPGPSTIVFEKNGGNYIFANGVTELELNPNMVEEEKTDYVYQWSLNNVDLQDSYST